MENFKFEATLTLLYIGLYIAGKISKVLDSAKRRGCVKWRRKVVKGVAYWEVV
jgi:hypothetical protein